MRPLTEAAFHSFTVAATEKIIESFIRKILYLMLHGIGYDRIGLPGIVDDRLGKNAKVARRCHEPATPVAEPVNVSVNQDRWLDLRDVGSL